MPTLHNPGQDRYIVVPEHRARKLTDEGWEYHGEESEPPNISDNKPAWVEYAQTQGYDPDEGLTKDELIERYG